MRDERFLVNICLGISMAEFLMQYLLTLFQVCSVKLAEIATAFAHKAQSVQAPRPMTVSRNG